MSASANVRSIQSIDDLKASLTRFGGEAQEALSAADQEIRRTMDWLQERLNHWRNEMQRRQQAVRLAEVALARCEASDTRDQPAYCGAYERALLDAKVRLAEAEAELRNVQQWTRLVQQSVADYQVQAQRLATMLGSDLPKATALLGRKVADLQAYVTIAAPSGGTGHSTIPPMQAVANTFTTSVRLAAVDASLTGAAIAITNSLVSDVRQALGEHGEQIAADLLSKKFGLQELPFDQPKHGFDRVFTAPGVPLIVMESKVNLQGQFHPGQTQAGQQGAPDWIAAHGQKMSDPSSAEWSPANERVAALVSEIGPENVPAVAVVMQTETGRADVYYRAPGNTGWQPLQDGVSLADALRGSSAPGPGPLSPPEFREGNLGAQERGG